MSLRKTEKKPHQYETALQFTLKLYMYRIWNIDCITGKNNKIHVACNYEVYLHRILLLTNYFKFYTNPLIINSNKTLYYAINFLQDNVGYTVIIRNNYWLALLTIAVRVRRTQTPEKIINHGLLEWGTVTGSLQLLLWP